MCDHDRASYHIAVNSLQEVLAAKYFYWDTGIPNIVDFWKIHREE